MARSNIENLSTGATIRAALNAMFTELYYIFTGKAGGLTLFGGTLTTQRLSLRGNATDITTGGVDILDSTEATAKTDGALHVAGGISSSKKAFFGDTTVDSLNVIGASNVGAVEIGTLATPKTITLAGDSSISNVVNVVSVADASEPVTLGAIYGKAANTTLDQPNVQVVGVLARASMGKNAIDAYGMQSHASLLDGAESSGNMTAVSGKTILYDDNASGIVTAGLFTLEGQASDTHGAVPRKPNTAYGVWVDVVDTDIDAGIEVHANASQVAAGIKFDKTGIGAIAKDIVMQNGETIDNATDGVVACSGIFSAPGVVVGSVAGVLKGTAGTIGAASAGTDFVAPTGVSGGQTIEGGTAASEDLTLTSTHNATKGSVFVGGDGSTNSIEIEADGTLVMKGTAMVWDDVIVQAGNLRPGTPPPAFAAFTGGIYEPSFIAGQADEVHGAFEIPHSYKEGTDLIAHIHCAPSTTDAGNIVVGFEYEAITNGGVATATTNTPIAPTAMSGVAKKLSRLDVATIPGAGRKIGDIIPFRFYRQNGGTDTFTGDLFVMSVGLHFEMDTLGSRGIVTK